MSPMCMFKGDNKQDSKCYKREQTKNEKNERINILFIGCFFTFALDFLLFIVKAFRDCSFIV